MPQTPVDASVPAATGEANRRALWTVLVVAVLIRGWAMASLPLIFTNDSAEYLHAATNLYDGQAAQLSSVRTPAYPMFLAGTFVLFGLDQNAILAGHHLLGIFTALLLAWSILPLVGPGWAATAGVMFSLDPYVLAFESYLLTETLALHLVVMSAALVLRGAGRGPVSRLAIGLLLGVLLAAAALTRPALQAVVPFFAIGWLLMYWRTWAARGAAGLVIALGVGALLVPWMQYNQTRDVPRVANGFSSMQWWAFARYGVLDWEYPIADEVRTKYQERYGDSRPGFYDLLDYMHDVGAWDRRADEFAAWNRASLVKNFDRYAHVWAQALCWQLNVRVGLEQDDQLRWFLFRLGEDGTSHQMSTDHGLRHRPQNHIVDQASGGSGRAFYGWFQEERIPGLPQVPLFGAAVCAMVLGVYRRQWALTFVLLGTTAYMLAHVSLLLPQTRYCLPAWPVWYLAVACLPALWRGSRLEDKTVVSERDSVG